MLRHLAIPSLSSEVGALASGSSISFRNSYDSSYSKYMLFPAFGDVGHTDLGLKKTLLWLVGHIRHLYCPPPPENHYQHQECK
ncbi:hypothetical protein Avbf_17337, partial [Armadillidium vulgare]